MSNKAETLTGLLEFTSRRAFRQTQPLSRLEQFGAANGIFLTSSEKFANGILLKDPTSYHITRPRVSIPCLAREAWARPNYQGKSVLFLLPGEALGEAAATFLFLSAFIAQMKPAKVGVFCARSCSDIYARDKRLKVFPIWIDRQELRRWQIVIDLGQLETRRNIDLWPVDMEGELLTAFGGLSPNEARYPSAGRAVTRISNLQLGFFPIASSPLRTLPPEVGIALAKTLSPWGDLKLVLNTQQRQGQLFAEAVTNHLPANAKIQGTLPTIADLLDQIAALDYAVFADSGPAHLSKLVGTRGLTVYSSAPGALLTGRFSNLARWQIEYSGPHCTAPCGLAKLRKGADGAVGCMGSLQRPLAELPYLAGLGDANQIDRLQHQPIPCLNHLAKSPSALIATLEADLAALFGPKL